jgi:RNA recognition motif-containing protein
MGQASCADVGEELGTGKSSGSRLTSRSRQKVCIDFGKECGRVKTVYVGNLPFSATEEQVRELFARYGTVQAVRLITDRNTGRLRGFGFVEMEQDAAALAAMTALNGTDMDGRALTVNEARPRRERHQRPSRHW